MINQAILNKRLITSRVSRCALILFCLTQIYCTNPLEIDYIILPPIKDFSVANENEAWLVTQEGKVLHFTDGGKKVAEAEFPEKIIQIFFLNASEGWALSENGQLWTTTSGGKDWIKKSLFEDKSIALHSNQLVFADNQIGWLRGNFRVLVSQDGGASWDMVYPTNQFGYEALKGQPMSISAVNSDIVWMGFSAGAVLRTTNRGKDWERVKSPGNYDIWALEAFSADECIVSGWNRGGLFHTTDGGKTWRQMLPPEFRRKSGIESISFINKNKGWAAGLNFVNSPDSTDTDLDFLLKTTDGGKTWTKVETGIKEPHGFDRVKFTNEKNGWLLGDRTIYRTPDGGDSWVEVFKVKEQNSK